MKRTLAAAVAAAAIAAFTAPIAQADSIGEVEGARAKDRQGSYLTRQDREQLRRYGDTSDPSSYYGYGYGDGAYYDGPYGEPSVGIYVGPRRYYGGPYGY